MRSAPANLDDCLSIHDLRALAQRRLPAPIFHYMDGGAEDEATLQRNTAAFEAYRLVPKCLVDVSNVRTATRVLGQDLQWPLLCSPTGASRFYHAEGELAVARAAEKAGVFYGLSIAATHSLETVAASGNGPKMFQLLPFKDRELTRQLIERCKRAGYAALCLTVDAAVRGKRERELRAGMGVLPRLSFASIGRFALCPRWLLSQVPHGPLSMPNLAGRASGSGLLAHGKYLNEQLDCALGWNEVRAMIELWGGPFAIKGVMRPDDARLAADAGATAVIVSNHGGRQLDGAAAAIDALPRIVDAVGDRIEVIVDGGIRRGVHILKALALGAKACCVGRPYLYGLGAGGERGAGQAMELLQTELVRAMQLTGCTDVRNMDKSLVERS
jgi:L-lactate dehydrogenase (cytochrome)